MKTIVTSLTLVCLTVATVAAAQSIDIQPTAPSSVDKIAPVTRPLEGTLFFGRDQRDQMDRVRKLGAVAVISDEGVLVEPAVSVLNGFVKRSDGQSAIWVDGQPRYNVQGDGVRRLQPQDVGGTADTVRVLSRNLTSPANANRPPKVKRIPNKKALRKRVMPKS